MPVVVDVQGLILFRLGGNEFPQTVELVLFFCAQFLKRGCGDHKTTTFLLRAAFGLRLLVFAAQWAYVAASKSATV